MKPLLVLLFISAVAVAPIEAGIKDGNELSDALSLWKKAQVGGSLSAGEQSKTAYVLGYLGGFLHSAASWEAFGENAPFRFPKGGIDESQFLKMVDKFLNEHPQRLHEIADGLLLVVLRESFPNPAFKAPTPSR